MTQLRAGQGAHKKAVREPRKQTEAQAPPRQHIKQQKREVNNKIKKK
jgi:hypothetical protein